MSDPAVQQEFLKRGEEIKRLKDLVCDREDTIIERDATIGRVRALVADPHAAFVVDRIRAALESTS